MPFNFLADSTVLRRVTGRNSSGLVTRWCVQSGRRDRRGPILYTCIGLLVKLHGVPAALNQARCVYQPLTLDFDPTSHHMTNEIEPNQPEHKPRPLVDLAVSILIPSLVLMKLSGDDKLGATNALILALSFPICWGVYELVTHKHRNYIALLGVVSVLLTGGIGLLKLDAQWLAVKEAAVPSVIGIGVLVAHKLGYPVIRKLLLNPKLFKVSTIESVLEKRNNRPQFESRLDNANYLFAGTFVFSAVMNYLLAKWIVKSDSGTAAFNEELGRMTLLSYPVIAIPSMIMTLFIFYYLWRTINTLTGLSLEEIMVDQENS